MRCCRDVVDARDEPGHDALPSGTSLNRRLGQFVPDPSVMAGLVPAIHAFAAVYKQAWMPGTGPRMTT